jgi:hypothetical protein
MVKTKACHCCNGSGTELDHKMVGSEMRTLRKTRKLTIAMVSKRTKFSVPYISDLEHGKRNWRAELIERYLKAVNKNIK